MKFETQYAMMMSRILHRGIQRTDRTGTGTRTVTLHNMTIENPVTDFPILKGKKVYPKMALKEIVWMMMGRTDVAWLEKRGVNYWRQWQDENGTIGKGYGHQFRNFNGTDQLQDVLDQMKNLPDSRRIMINLWNASDIDSMTLPPCPYLYKFVLYPTKQGYTVDMSAVQRSCDTFLGVPYNAMYFSWMLEIICRFMSATTDKIYTSGTIYYTLQDAHIYSNHEQQCLQYLSNANQNTDGVIDSKAEIQLPDVPKGCRGIGEYLAHIDSDYSAAKITKHYTEQYGEIKADVAV